MAHSCVSSYFMEIINKSSGSRIYPLLKVGLFKIQGSPTEDCITIYREMTAEQARQVLSDPDLMRDRLPNACTLAGKFLHCNLFSSFSFSKICLDTASKHFSELTRKAVFKSFCGGKNYIILTVRFLLEYINAFDLTEDELRLMMTSLVEFPQPLSIEKRGRKDPGSREEIGNQIRLMIESSGRQFFDDDTVPEILKQNVRKAISGRIYLHFDDFFRIVHYCGYNVVDILMRLRNLSSNLRWDKNYSIFHPEESTNSAADTSLLDISRQFEECFSSSTYISKNLIWIKNHYPDVFRAMEQDVAKLDDPTPACCILTASNIIGCQVDDLIYNDFSMNSDFRIQNSQDTQDVHDAQNDYDKQDVTDNTTEQEENKGEDDTVEENKSQLVIRESNVMVCICQPCDRFDWKNENLNRKEPGYFWETLSDDDDRIVKLQQSIMDSDPDTLSACRIKELAEGLFYGQRYKVLIRMATDDTELIVNIRS